METEKLSLAFELTRDSWLTMPRCLMGAMPADWQNRMAPLMEEFRAAWPRLHDVRASVQVRREYDCTECVGAGLVRGDDCPRCGGSGKLNSYYPGADWLHEYRRPLFDSIALTSFPDGYVPTQAEFDAALERVRHNPAIEYGHLSDAPAVDGEEGK